MSVLCIPSLSWLLDMIHLGPVRLFKERCYSLKIILVLNQGRDSPRLQRCQLRLHLQIFKGKLWHLLNIWTSVWRVQRSGASLKINLFLNCASNFLLFFSFFVQQIWKSIFLPTDGPGFESRLGMANKIYTILFVYICIIIISCELPIE